MRAWPRPTRSGDRYNRAVGQGHASEVSRLTDSIRELACGQRVRQHLETSRGRWYQLVACLDALGDTELAIAAYFSTDEADKGALYLATYGVFQAFVIQQDAAQILAQCLAVKKVSRKKYKELGQIRFLRNRIAGHPTRTNGGHRNLEAILTDIGADREDIARMVALADAHEPKQPEEFHAVCRMTLSVGRCDILTSGHHQTDQYQAINVRHLAELQQQAMTKMLTAILEKFRRQDAARCAAFADVLFSDMLAEAEGALGNAKHLSRSRDDGPDWDSLGRLAEALAKVPAAMQDELDRRGRRLHDIQALNGKLAEEARSIAQAMAGGQRPVALADAFVEYADWAFAELRELAGELDREYRAYIDPTPADDEAARAKWAEYAKAQQAAGEELRARISAMLARARAGAPPAPSDPVDGNQPRQPDAARVRLVAQLLRGRGGASSDALLLPECAEIAADIAHVCRPWAPGGQFAGPLSTSPWKQLRLRVVTFSERMAARGLASERYLQVLAEICGALQSLESLESDRQGFRVVPAFGPYLRARAAILEKEVGALEERALATSDPETVATRPVIGSEPRRHSEPARRQDAPDSHRGSCEGKSAEGAFSGGISCGRFLDWCRRVETLGSRFSPLLRAARALIRRGFARGTDRAPEEA